MGLLQGTSCYLIGSIEGASDAGRGWRQEVKSDLGELGIKCYDPCEKPFLKDIDETESMQVLVKRLRQERDYDRLAKAMKEIRHYDLRLCDLATFGFAYIDLDCPTCGSWEEISWLAARLNKPLFFVCKQGKDHIPLWMFGLMPHKYFYDSIKEAVQMIWDIDSGRKPIDSDRWKLLRKEYR